MERSEDLEDFLRRVSSRPLSDPERQRVTELIRARKREAVKRGDEATSKQLWCYETILHIQDTYLAAFAALRSGSFYEAWTLLERVEIAGHSLERHCTTEDDPHRVRFIAAHTKKLQSIFPYKWFMSPGVASRRTECSICRARVNPRKLCGHRKGEIYGGEECIHQVSEMNIVEISFVTNPVHKYAVPFFLNPETGKVEDQYNYALPKYLMARLQSPFDPWDVGWTHRRHPHSRYADTSPTEPCPCESGKVYEECCLREEGVLRPHCDFIFSVPPPEPLLTAIEYT